MFASLVGIAKKASVQQHLAESGSSKMKSYIEKNDKEWIAKIRKLPEYELVTIERGIADTIPIYTVRPSRADRDASGWQTADDLVNDLIDPDYDLTVFIYVHGGGFVGGKGEAGLAEAILIASRLQMRVVSVDYRLAPEYPYPAAIEDVLRVYSYYKRMEPYTTIVLGGTSAGANIAMVVIQRLIRQRKPLPSAAYFGAPAVDLEGGGITLRSNKGFDLVLGDYKQYYPAIKAYSGNRSLEDVEISPIFGSFQGFPPSLLVSGTRDILLSSAVSAHIKMRKSEVNADILVYEGASHVEYLHKSDSEDSKHLYRELNMFIKKNCRTLIEDCYDIYVYAYPILMFDRLWNASRVGGNEVFDLGELLKSASQREVDGSDVNGVWVDLRRGPVVLKVTETDYSTYCLFDALFRPITADFTNLTRKNPSEYSGRSFLIIHTSWKGSIPTEDVDGTLHVDSLLLLFVEKRMQGHSPPFRSVDVLHAKPLNPHATKKHVIHVNTQFMSASALFGRYMSIIESLNITVDDWIYSKMRKVGMVHSQTQRSGGAVWSPVERLNIGSIPADVEAVWKDDMNIENKTAKDDMVRYNVISGNQSEMYYDNALRGQTVYANTIPLPWECEYTVISRFSSAGAPLEATKTYRITLAIDGREFAWWSATTPRQEKVSVRSGKTTISIGGQNNVSNTSNSPFSIVVRVYRPSSALLEFLEDNELMLIDEA